MEDSLSCCPHRPETPTLNKASVCCSLPLCLFLFLFFPSNQKGGGKPGFCVFFFRSNALALGDCLVSVGDYLEKGVVREAGGEGCECVEEGHR